MADLLLKKEAPKFNLEKGGSFLFYISLAAFFLALAGYGGLLIINRSQTNTKNELQNQIKFKEEDLRPELINQIFLLDQRLKNMRALISQHIFPSNVLRLIESDTHPQVQFNNFSLSADNRRLEMAGQTTSFAVLSRQISLLENDPQIERVDFGGLSFGANNLLGFKLTITFKPTLLQVRPQ